jgi:DNA-directed RNA polymerase specialized sigma24 family protein
MTTNWVHERGTEQDWRGLLASSSEELRWLCYTLTGDKDLSEKAPDAALQQSLKGAGQVFREWMPNWIRRLIIKFCIVSVRPADSPAAQRRPPFPVATNFVSREHLERVLSQPSPVLQQKLLRLEAVSRFVFVLRAIEGYSRRDTALLLNIDDRTCEWVFLQAAAALDSNPILMEHEPAAAVLTCA